MGSEARARVALVALLGVTLLAFSELYGGGAYPGPSLLGIAFAIGIAVGMRRLGAGSPLTVLASVVGLVVYLSWIFQGSKTWFLVPTPASLSGLVRSVSQALEKASVDYAPVPARPGYVILTVIGLWALATIGELATFRWRKPLIASLGCVAMFAFLMVVGTRKAGWFLVALFLIVLFAYWSLEAAHRLRSWGSWVSVWREHHNEPPVLNHSTARRMGGAAIVIALASPLFTPAIGDAILKWKSGLGDGTGAGGASGQINPLVSLEQRIVNQSAEEMFRVYTDEPTKWKLLTLERFVNDKEWASGAVTSGDIGEVLENDGYLILPQTEDTQEFRTRFNITGLRGDDLPIRAPATGITFEDGGSSEDVLAKEESGDLRFTAGDGLTGEELYEVTSLVPDLTYQELLDARKGDHPNDDLTFVSEDYTQATDHLAPVVKQLRDEWLEGIESDGEMMVALQERLTGPEFTYDLNVGRQQLQSPSGDPLKYFLIDSKTGYCQQYATAFALLARSLGFPTRIAVGFLPGDRVGDAPPREDAPLPDDSIYTVTGRAAHAWPEVYFEEYGWLAFEPTPRDDVATPAPAYTSPISASPDVRVPPSGSNIPEGQGPQGLGPQPDDPTAGRGGPLELPADDPDVISDAWKEPFARLALGVIALLVLFLIAVPLLKAWIVKERYRRARTPADRAAAAFAEFQQEATELAAPRSRSESAPSYAQRITEMKKLGSDVAARLASIYERAEYAPGGVEPNIAEEAHRLARRLRSALWKNAGWWDRLNRLFSIKALRSARSV